MGAGVVTSDGTPVYDVPPSSDVVPSSWSELLVIGMLPQVKTKYWYSVTRNQGVVLIRGRTDE